jgi:hypothetical protein
MVIIQDKIMFKSPVWVKIKTIVTKCKEEIQSGVNVLIIVRAKICTSESSVKCKKFNNW